MFVIYIKSGGEQKNILTVLTTCLTVLLYFAQICIMTMVALMKYSLNSRPNFEEKKGLGYCTIGVLTYLYKFECPK